MEIKELTIGKFNEAYEHRMLEVEGVFQFLSIKKKDFSTAQLSVACFSDGFYFEEFTFDPKIRADFEKSTKQFDIVKLQFCYYDYKTFQHLMILKFQPILSGISEPIGNPIQYSQKSINHVQINSNNMIPATAKKISPCSTDTEIEEKTSPYQQFLKKRDRMDFDESNFNSISELMLGDKLWLIKARVVSKQELRDFSKNNGKFFSIVLKDKTGEIRAVFFKNVAEQYYPKIKEGCVYSLTGGEVEKASNYNCTSNPLEIIFKDNVLIQEQKNDISIPIEEPKFFTIADILEKRENDVVDIVAMVRDQHDMEIKDAKKGIMKELRKIRIHDSSEKEIDISVWGNSFHKISILKNEVYYFRNMKIRLFNNSKYLLWENYSKAELSVSDPEIMKRMNNFKAEVESKKNKTIPPKVFKPKDTIQENTPKNHINNIGEIIKKSNEFFKDDCNKNKKLFFDLVGFIDCINENIWYESCGFRNCKKKITKNEENVYFCSKCNVDIEKPVLRFMCNLRVLDAHHNFFGRIFGEENCVHIFQKSIDELFDLLIVSQDQFNEFLKEKSSNEYFIKLIVKYNTQPTDELYSIEIISVSPIEKELVKTCGCLFDVLSRKKMSN